MGGGGAAQLKQFIDQAGRLWQEGKLADKAATSFTSSQTAPGGQESTILALNNTLYHSGMVIAALGYTVREVFAAGGTRMARPTRPATGRPVRTRVRSMSRATRASGSPATNRHLRGALARNLRRTKAQPGDLPRRDPDVITDRAIYRNGRRVAEPPDLPGMGEAGADGDGVAWVSLHRPSKEEFAAVAREFDLHRRSVEDAVHAHQRPKLERYGETLFCVLRAARYIDDAETVEFSEVHVFAARRFVITVRHGEAPDVPALRRSLESRPDLLRRGPVAILHAIMDRVIDDYGPVVTGVGKDIDEIEDEIFGGTADVSGACTNSRAR